MHRIAIIGAGPAGIAASIAASAPDNEVHLFDSNDKIGRKLSITGSGRGNLSNRNVAADKYHCDCSETIKTILQKFGHERLVEWLLERGLPTYTTSDGWCYPLSNSAANVVNILEAHLEDKKVQIHKNHKVIDIKPFECGFHLSFQNKQDDFECAQLVIACGGRALPKLGCTGELFPILERLGHPVIPITPALAPILTESRSIHPLQGVRLDLHLSLFHKNKAVAETWGNAIFTERGLNGPAAMDISHWIPLKCKEEDFFLAIDFLHDNQGVLEKILLNGKNGNLPLMTLLGSVLPMKVIRLILRSLKMPEDIKVWQLDGEIKNRLIQALIDFKVAVKGIGGFDECQASAGGVRLKDVNPLSLESRIIPGLYFAGEVLNVVGPCGGYNLHWAFSSGVIAGDAAGKNS